MCLIGGRRLSVVYVGGILKHLPGCCEWRWWWRVVIPTHAEAIHPVRCCSELTSNVAGPVAVHPRCRRVVQVCPSRPYIVIGASKQQRSVYLKVLCQESCVISTVRVASDDDVVPFDRLCGWVQVGVPGWAQVLQRFGNTVYDRIRLRQAVSGRRERQAAL